MFQIVGHFYTKKVYLFCAYFVLILYPKNVLILYFFLVWATKFRVNWPFGSGEEAAILDFQPEQFFFFFFFFYLQVSLMLPT